MRTKMNPETNLPFLDEGLYWEVKKEYRQWYLLLKRTTVSEGVTYTKEDAHELLCNEDKVITTKMVQKAAKVILARMIRNKEEHDQWMLKQETGLTEREIRKVERDKAKEAKRRAKSDKAYAKRQVVLDKAKALNAEVEGSYPPRKLGSAS